MTAERAPRIVVWGVRRAPTIEALFGPEDPAEPCAVPGVEPGGGAVPGSIT